MPQSSVDVAGRSRKNATQIFQRLSSMGQATFAQELGTSEATVSRWKSEQLEHCAKALAILGLKIVPIEMRCMDPKKIGAILELAKSHLAEIQGPEGLSWDDPD